MIEELQLINHYLVSKNTNFLGNLGLDTSYFITTSHIVEWIEQFKKDMKTLPTIDTVANKFDEFEIYSELENVDYLVSVLRSNKAYIEYRPILLKNAKMVEQGNIIEAMWQMRSDIDNLLKIHSSKMTRYDWVKDAQSRFDLYMQKHNKEGLSGITTGISTLDRLTGGWKNDDLILVAGRLNEGKSLLGGFFAYHVWLSFIKAGIKSPVIFISTEMPETEIAFRLDTIRSHFSNTALNQGGLSDPQTYREYLMDLEKKEASFLILTQEANNGRPFTPNDIKTLIEVEKPGFIVIDQLYDLSDGTGERDIRKRIVNVTNGIREVNLYTQTPTMLIAQAGRGAAIDARRDEKASPELHQIQESDAPAQKATRVITIRLINDVFKLSLKKNRGGVKNKDMYLRADIDRGFYDEIEEEALVF